MRTGLLLLLLCACGQEPITGDDLQVRVSVEGREVVSGRPFTLTVVRVFTTQLEPDAWHDRALEPLQVRATGTSLRVQAGRAEETRTFQAYAFGSGRVAVPAVSFRARNPDGSERVVASGRINLDVVPALPAGAPGAPELPLALLPWPRSDGWVLPGLGILAVALAGSLWFARRGRRQPVTAPVPPPVAPPDPPGVVARAALQRLRSERTVTQAEIEAWHVAAAALLRDYVGARFGVTALEMTTRELLRALHSAVKPPDLQLLGSALRQCDLVKFAQHVPDAPARERLLAAAEQFLAGAA